LINDPKYDINSDRQRHFLITFRNYYSTFYASITVNSCLRRFSKVSRTLFNFKILLPTFIHHFFFQIRNKPYINTIACTVLVCFNSTSNIYCRRNNNRYHMVSNKLDESDTIFYHNCITTNHDVDSEILHSLR